MVTLIGLTFTTQVNAGTVVSDQPIIQDVDVAAFPKVALRLVLPLGLVPSGGSLPEVAISENGVAVADASVSSLAGERGPIDAVLLVDTSGSMAGAPLESAKAAASSFVDQMGELDRIAVVAFSSEPVLVLGFTSDRSAIAAAVNGLRAEGETALYDGLALAARIARDGGSAERYIVALSDGGDTMSINSADGAIAALLDAEAPVYAVALESPEYNVSALNTIARQSSGRLVTATAPGALEGIYAGLAREIQQRYLVVFQSSRPNTAEIEIAVTVGSGASAREVLVAIPNPQYRTDAQEPSAPFEPLEDNRAALAVAVGAGGLAVVALSLAIWAFLRRDRAALEQLGYYDIAPSGNGEGPAEPQQAPTVRTRLMDALTAVVDRRGALGKIQRELEAGGLALRANEFVYLVGLAGAVLALALWVLTRSAAAIILAAVMMAAGPPILLRFAASRRLKKFEAQLPDILDLIAGSLRSGWGVQQALDLVVDEVGEPARAEFRRTQAEARLGMPFDEALQRMARRVDSPDLKWAVNAISIQREVGGNLAEVLGVVSATIRERGELGRLVSALTAEGRVSLVVLTVLPFAVFGGLFVMNREYVMVALANPIGVVSLVFGVLLLVVGIVWLNRIIKIEV